MLTSDERTRFLEQIRFIESVAENNSLSAASADQARIAQKSIEWICLLLRKNADYGSAVWKEPILCPNLSAEQAILVRMSDKVERIRNILKTSQVLVSTERLEDTISDLGAYALLWLAKPEDRSEEEA